MKAFGERHILNYNWTLKLLEFIILLKQIIQVVINFKWILVLDVVGDLINATLISNYKRWVFDSDCNGKTKVCRESYLGKSLIRWNLSTTDQPGLSHIYECHFSGILCRVNYN